MNHEESEAPGISIQAPENIQTPISKTKADLIAFSDLELLWMLELGVWILKRFIAKSREDISREATLEISQPRQWLGRPGEERVLKGRWKIAALFRRAIRHETHSRSIPATDVAG